MIKINLENDKIILLKYGEKAWEKLNEINLKRANILSYTVAFVTFILLLIDYIHMKQGLWMSTPGYILLFYTHLVQEIGALFFILSYLIFKAKINSSKDLSLLYVYSFILFLINICAFTSGWADQFIHGEISVYIMSCTVFAVFFYLKPKYFILFYVQSFINFLIYITMTQDNLQILQAHYVNSTLSVILSMIIAITVSKMMERDTIYKYNLEEIVNERTTKLKESLETVQRLERLNLVGKMAATVGHEVRNPLTAIKGFLQLMKGKQSEPEHIEYFDIMISEIDRANSIITKFLSISRNKATIMNRGNLKEVVSSILPLIEADAIYRNMKLIADLNEVPDILLNEQEINQLVLNLARNGIEAMEAGGCLTIKIDQRNDKVILTVSDEGPGIEQDILDKLGTPFFSTKETGTGLGLVVCNSIAERHNAEMKIKSSSEGASFEVYFKITSPKEFEEVISAEWN
ncbi:ATP-binding protein [Desulfitobacterium sp. AusDCA]|uniref:ATP-binding protein n=1 Tax=Desulfitobacterium sp. AusDCA TaxID=3240383 RepID=UPI003DA6D504